MGQGTNGYSWQVKITSSLAEQIRIRKETIRHTKFNFLAFVKYFFLLWATWIPWSQEPLSVASLAGLLTHLWSMPHLSSLYPKFPSTGLISHSSLLRENYLLWEANPSKVILDAVVDRVITLQRYSWLNPRIFQFFQGISWVGLRLRTLRWEEYPGLSRWT